MEVAAEAVGQRYGRRVVLDGVTAQFHPGVTGILGPNGAGKSTLIKVLATVMGATRGTVHYDTWQVPGDEAPVRRRLGYVPQLYALYDRMTGQEFLSYAAAMKGLPVPTVADDVSQALEAVGLASAARARIRTYSGGMRQRLVVAQALLGHPALLILDEPSAGLDPEERGRLKNVLATLGARSTILLSTHIVSDLEDVATQVLVMDHGRILAAGPLASLERRAAGRVQELTLPLDEWAAQQSAWAERPAPERPVVAAVRQHGSAVRVRVVQPYPTAEVAALAPTAEDGYLATLADGRTVAP